MLGLGPFGGLVSGFRFQRRGDSEFGQGAKGSGLEFGGLGFRVYWFRVWGVSGLGGVSLEP